MEQEKVQILSEMYAIRSVLSIVSQNEDEVQYIINNEINHQKQTMDSIWRTNISRKSDIENVQRSQNEETRRAIGRNTVRANALLQQQNEEMARLAQNNYSAQEMNKALLEKISTSSDRLVADMESQLRANGISYYN
ncbi:MAG: hypothetical protein ACI4MH_03545 [Candidatus Coproplasma sp.]